MSQEYHTFVYLFFHEDKVAIQTWRTFPNITYTTYDDESDTDPVFYAPFHQWPAQTFREEYQIEAPNLYYLESFDLGWMNRRGRLARGHRIDVFGGEFTDYFTKIGKLDLEWIDAKRLEMLIASDPDVETLAAALVARRLLLVDWFLVADVTDERSFNEKDSLEKSNQYITSKWARNAPLWQALFEVYSPLWPSMEEAPEFSEEEGNQLFPAKKSPLRAVYDRNGKRVFSRFNELERYVFRRFRRDCKARAPFYEEGGYNSDSLDGILCDMLVEFAENRGLYPSNRGGPEYEEWRWMPTPSNAAFAARELARCGLIDGKLSDDICSILATPYTETDADKINNLDDIIHEVAAYFAVCGEREKEKANSLLKEVTNWRSKSVSKDE